MRRTAALATVLPSRARELWMNGDGENRRPTLRLVSGRSGRERPKLPTGSDDPDALAVASLSGDLEALHELVQGNGALVLAIVRRYARSQEDARDLVCRAFVGAALEAQNTLRRDPERVLAFRRSLLRTALHVARRHVSREGAHARARLELGPPHARAGAGAAPVAERDHADAARAAVVKLPRRAREVLTLVLDAELRLPEIADLLGITLQAARANLRKATLLLRARLPALRPGASCREFAASLPLRAIGALDQAESVRAECHLAGCEACSGEARRIAEALAAAAPPPPSPAERRALDGVAARTLEALGRKRASAQILMVLRCERVGSRLLGALAATAIVALFAGALFGG
jgi:RNA polymerase sigma-70 factor (ECF subfamily)